MGQSTVTGKTANKTGMLSVAQQKLNGETELSCQKHNVMTSSMPLNIKFENKFAEVATNVSGIAV